MRLRQVVFAARDLDAVARRWAALLDRPLQEGPTGGIRIALDRGVIRFAAGAAGADGVTVIDIAVADRARVLAAAAARNLVDGDDVVLCGTRIRLM